LSLFEDFRRSEMVLKNVFAAIICAALLAWSGLSRADEYRPDDFLGLDLSRAALSPIPLGPPAQFVPGPLDVKVDRGSEPAQARAEPQAEPKAEPNAVPRDTRKVALRETRVVHARAEKPRGAARTKLARRHGNPLDAQAFDTRIQVWPCKSGGICNWRR
jgi:hypothetical protein